MLRIAYITLCTNALYPPPAVPQSDAAQTMQEIRARDPAFDLNKLIAGVKADAPIVVTAFLKHDLATLAAHCGTELMERFTGIFK